MLKTKVHPLIQKMGPYGIILQIALIALPLLTGFRVLFSLWQWDRVQASDVGIDLLIQGMRADLIMVSLLLAPLVLLIPLFAHRFTWSFWRWIAVIWGAAGLTLLVFMEVSTPAFMMQYDVRPNRLFVEYLKYPKEVFATLWEGFRFWLISGVVMTSLAAVYFYRCLKGYLYVKPPLSFAKTLLVWPLVVLLVALSIRSTTGHRPANPSFFAITGDPLVNSLVIDSTWSVAFAIYNLKHEAKSSEVYGNMPSEQMLQIVRSEPALQGYDFDDADRPTLHLQRPVISREKPLNLVIVLEESLGATYVESLGGLKGVTPYLEALKSDGWWFENLYATGTRSVRGIEAVVAGYMPTPARSTVKLSLSQQNFATIADVLSRQGYHTEFMYGGEAHFDNMRSFFTGNGFQQITDQKDIQSPEFVGSWGASDGDLFNKAHERFNALYEANKPFFGLVFSSSNHEPFEFPDGKIELYEEPKATVNNAVKYADYALGQFFKQAKNSDYWKDTLFLVVADHDSRVFGSELVPVKKFHIPGVIVGADMQAKSINTLASQIDLAPTLLSLMGIKSQHPFVGRDLVRDLDTPGRAMMQFFDNYAWMENGHVTILRPDQEAVQAKYDPEKRQLEAFEPADQIMQEKALAHALLAAKMYARQQYQIPKE